jgi:hypothetical protein
MITGAVAAADVAQLNRLYRHWYDAGNDPIGNEFYYAEPRLSRPLFNLLQPFDKTRIEQFLKIYAETLRDSIIEQAWANVAESMYRGGPHAQVNFVRVKLGVLCLSRYNSHLGKGYAHLAHETAMNLAIVAEHAAQAATNDRQLRQMAEKNPRIVDFHLRSQMARVLAILRSRGTLCDP